MATSRKRYSREFKLEAVRLLLEGDRGLAQTARDLNINRTMLSGWRKQYLEDPDGAFLGRRRRKAEDDVEQLRREIEELREEREILKKAVAYFAEENRQPSASSESTHTNSG